jgi:carbonic anhydrase
VYDIRTGFIKTQTSMIDSEEALKEVCKFEMGLIGN